MFLTLCLCMKLPMYTYMYVCMYCRQVLWGKRLCFQKGHVDCIICIDPIYTYGCMYVRTYVFTV